MADDVVGAPSLLDKEATGGEVAGKGFAFQDRILLTLIPEWLSRPGFSRLIREAYADTEAEFFVPGRGVTKEFIECKDHALAGTEFWAEIDRFLRFDKESPGSYHWFRLVCTGLSENLHPLKNGLRRIRDAYDFYRDDAPLIQASYHSYLGIVTKLGKTEEVAKFLFTKVRIEDEHVTGFDHTEALFTAALPNSLPGYECFTPGELRRTYTSLLAFVAPKINKPISRREIMSALHRDIDPARIPPPSALKVYTAIDGEEGHKALRLEWAAFSGEGSRIYPPADRWNSDVLDALTSTRNWIAAAYDQRRILVTGKRRLSAAIALGAVFSATSGFALDIEYRGGTVYRTDDYPPTGHTLAALDIDRSHSSSADLVVSVGIYRDITLSVSRALSSFGLEQSARTYILVPWPITSGADANELVARIKAEIVAGLSASGASLIHLFFSGPSFLAVLLGHRLNATATVQCYEWIGNDDYIASCKFST